jgi:hypothetical protein
MDKSNDVAEKLVTRFPEQAASIQRLLEKSREFREMCLDYVETRNALAHWRALSNETHGQTMLPARASPDQVAEQYLILLYELEVEILEALARDVEGSDGALV